MSAIVLRATLLGFVLVAFAPSANAVTANPAPRCEVVQGNADQLRANRNQRKRLGLRITEEAGVVTIHAPSHLLHAPNPIAVDGAELVSTSQGLGIKLDDEELCSQFRNLPVRKDDSVGAQLQVIRLSERGALLWSKESGLRFWPVTGKAAPAFRMIWHSPFELVYREPSGRSKGAKPSKKKRKKKRKKRRGRRRR